MGIPGALRPRTDSEILDASFALARRYWKELLPLALVFQIPISLLAWLPNLTRESVEAGAAPAHFGSMARQLLLVFFVVPIFDAVRLWYLESALIGAIETGRIDWPAARKRVAGVAWRLTGTTVAYWFLSGVCSLAFVIPGIIFYLHRRFYAEVLLVEGQPNRGSFDRSHQLTYGHVLRVGSLLLSLGIIAWALSIGCTSIPSVHGILGGLVGGVVLAGVSLAQASLYLLLYYNLRARREGIDLVERDAQLGFESVTQLGSQADARLQGSATLT